MVARGCLGKIMSRIDRGHNMDYSMSALAKSSAGIETPNRSAEALTRSAFFSPVFYGGLYRGSSERRSLVGSFNSVQSATLLLIPNTHANGGSSLNLSEATTMSNLYDIAIETHLNDAEIDALSVVFKKLLGFPATHFATHFTDSNEFQAVHALAGVKKVLTAMHEIREGQDG